MEPLSPEQFNALPKEAGYLLYKTVIEQFNVLEAHDIQLEKKVDELQESINVLVHQRFGRKTEKTQIDGQYEMTFDAAGNYILNEVEKLVEAGRPKEPDEKEAITCTRTKSKGRREADLRGARVVEDPVIEIPAEKLKELFPHGYKRLPDDIYSKLDYIPVQFVLHHRHIAVYADSRNEGLIVRADRPHELLDHSLLTESLAAGIITAKYVNGAPLNRYSQAVAIQFDVHLDRQVMAGWVIELHKRYLYRIYDRMHKEIFKSRLIHCDETPFKLIHSPKPDAGPNHKSYMWVYHAHEDYGSPPIYLYQYCDGRGSDYPGTFLDGYSGILVTDGYEVYHSLARKRDDLSVAGCWVHAKRHFAAICKADGSDKAKGTVAEEAVLRIADIFHKEHQGKAKSPDEKLEYRNTVIRPLVDSYFAWLKQIRPMVDKSSETGRAITYNLNQEPFLRAFLNNPIIPLDNNDAERSIRKFVIGRKNWVVIDSVNGAKASAALYSIVETAKANGLRPYFYIRYILSVMKEHADEVFDQDAPYIEELLPWSDKLPAECHIETPLPNKTS